MRRSSVSTSIMRAAELELQEALAVARKVTSSSMPVAM